MSGKKISIGAKPTAKPVPAAADAWVESRGAAEQPEPMKRLTIDITESLHRRIKAQCAMDGTKIADQVRELLIQKFGNS
jgi:hypothetical protein